ncbi:MAG: DNA gyrase inhibitor YacG [Acidobacteria bacterium]|nr:DNA gyrase inhibitor YacG [Acidobacteriota bacterium]
MQPSPVCANCGRKPADPVWRPFCSERCKLVDLGRWLAGEYRVPWPPVPPDEQEDTD